MLSDVLERSSSSLGTMIQLAKAGRGSGQLLAPVVKTWLLGDFCADPRYVRCVLELGLAAEDGARERLTGPHHDATTPLPEGVARPHAIQTALGPATLELIAQDLPAGPRVRMRMEWPDGEGVVKVDVVDAGGREELGG